MASRSAEVQVRNRKIPCALSVFCASMLGGWRSSRATTEAPARWREGTCLRGDARSESARDATAAPAARCVSGIGFEVVRTVRSAVDSYHRQDNDGCRFRSGVDVPASARIARFVGKPNDIAHCNPLAASKSLLWTYRVGASP